MKLMKNAMNIILGINAKKVPILKGKSWEKELKFFLCDRRRFSYSKGGKGEFSIWRAF